MTDQAYPKTFFFSDKFFVLHNTVPEAQGLPLAPLRPVPPPPQFPPYWSNALVPQQEYHVHPSVDSVFSHAAFHQCRHWGAAKRLRAPCQPRGRPGLSSQASDQPSTWLLWPFGEQFHRCQCLPFLSLSLLWKDPNTTLAPTCQLTVIQGNN